MLVLYKRKLLQTRFLIFGLLSILIIFLVILIYSKNAFSFDLPIIWDENEEENIVGYKIFCREEGQNYNYDAPVWVGTGTACTIYDLDDLGTYYLVARAFNNLDMESEDSDELKVELIDGEIKVNISTNSYSFIGSGCFITAGDCGL
jgi:hypothetical protein